MDVKAAVAEQLERQRRREVYDATLDFVGRWTGRRELPAATQGDSFHCVLANALGGQWNGSDWHPTASDVQDPERQAAQMRISIPEEVQEFIQRFDRGEFPELIGANHEGSS